MGRFLRVSFVTLMCGFLVAANVAAQGATSGFAGIVKDTSGAILPGVTVEAASPALIEKVRTATTDDHGEYKIISLRPGTYTLTFTLPGFGTVKREGIELASNFTASVNIALQVGGVEETITVTGEAPIVDVQNLTQQKRLTQDVLAAVPTGRTEWGLIQLMPSVIIPPDTQDVGGSQGEFSSQASLHGSKQGDQRTLQDGMRFNGCCGGSFGYYINAGAAQDILIQAASGGSAESSSSGVEINTVPKDGGNRFSGSFLANYGGSGLEGNNLTSALITAGLTQPNRLISTHDYNFGVGGPILHDRLWFYSAHRFWGNQTQQANFYTNLSIGTNKYTQGPPGALPIEKNRSHTIRFTAQMGRNKITAFDDYQNNCNCPNNETVNDAPEAVFWIERNPTGLKQITWTFPATNRLLFESGVTNMGYVLRRFLPDITPPNAISVTEQSTGFTYQAPPYHFRNSSPQFNGREVMTYVTGSNSLKAGMFWEYGNTYGNMFRNPTGVTYTYNQGTAVSLTEYSADDKSPLRTHQVMSPELGLYVQDQWTRKRVTLNGGLRFEYLRAYVPANALNQASVLMDARSYPAVNCVPCWKDLVPRASVAYDLFGTGETVIKASVGKYVTAASTSIASANDPVNTSINQVNRAWTDTNLNGVPDCDLRNPLKNGECDKMSNPNFGLPRVTTTYDPNLLNGWGKRGYNWQWSASVEHTLRPGLAVNAGFFRTSFGNFTATDSLNVTPQNYDQYCITVPTDSRLPGGGGNQICGLYDIQPTFFGLDGLNRIVTFASTYGKQTETYNGIDLGVNARFGRGLLSGGVSIGNSQSQPLTSQITAAAGTVSHTNNCFVVDSPQQLYQCDVQPPYKAQAKILGSYPLPWNMQVSGNLQSVPGPNIGATYAATTADIAKTLGRPLAGGVKTVPIQVIAPFSLRGPRFVQVDMRLTKKVQLGRARLQGSVDVYNLTNSSAILSYNPNVGPQWQTPFSILNPRLVKFAVQMDF